MDTKTDDKSVTAEAAPAAAKTDDRGVSWENRAKEYERKLKETETRLKAIESAEQEKARAAEAARASLPEEKQKMIAEFVEDPTAFLDRYHQKRKFDEDLPAAEEQIKKSPYFTDWDHVGGLIRDHRVNMQEPVRGAKTVLELLKAQALEREFAEKKREASVERSSGEGSGRAVPAAAKGPTRKELLKELASAERKGDKARAAILVSQLEDVRG
jgi:hypothetical protein